MAMKKNTKQLLLIGGLGVGGFLAYNWWQGRQAGEAEAAAYYPYPAGGGVGGGGGGFGSILWGGDMVCPKGKENEGTPEEEPVVITEEGEKIEAVGTTPMGSTYRILESGESEIWNPYTKQWEEIWWPGPAVVKQAGKAPIGELSAELVRSLQFERLGYIPSRGYTLPDVPTTPTTTRLSDLPTPDVLGGLTGYTPMGTAYRLESLKAGAPAHVYDPYAADKYGLGGWKGIAYPGPAVVKQPGYQPIGEPSAQAARARQYTRAADAARAAAARAAAQVITKQPGPQPYGEPSAQAARAASAASAAAQRVTTEAQVAAARAAAGQIAYPTFAPSTAAQALIARVPMAGGGHL